jgi:hypothetical protein
MFPLLKLSIDVVANRKTKIWREIGGVLRELGPVSRDMIQATPTPDERQVAACRFKRMFVEKRSCAPALHVIVNLPREEEAECQIECR